jgi:sec-independent protein translocase protein TatC
MAKARNPERAMSLGAHLVELRNRLFWSVLFVAAGTVAGWMVFDQVFQVLQAPVKEISAAKNIDATINFGTVVGAFDTRVQVSIFLGILLASPFWLYQLWAFITPGLKKRERKYTFGFLGAAIPLFAAGVYVAWVSVPAFVIALLGFTPEGAANVINANEYMLFILRILVVFGLAFVLPVVLVMLNFAGVLSAKGILKGWRIAVMVIAVIAALATPVSDPMSMFLLMLPLIALYYLSAGIAAVNDKRRARKMAKQQADIDADLANPDASPIE